MKHWLWPFIFGAYLLGCYTLGWENPAISGLVIVLALLAFLGLKRLDESLFRFAKPKGDTVNGFQAYWQVLKIFNDSTEMMAIVLLLPALFFGAYYATLYGLHPEHLPHFHIPWVPVLTIIGIMSAANNAMSEILQKLDRIEAIIGKYPTLVLVSLLSSLTGEPANAAIQNQYLVPRLPDDPKIRAKVGVGVAAAIGSGGGLTFFSPPAVIIIWSVMTSVFGWGLGTLIIGVGGIVTAHVIACVAIYGRHLKAKQHQDHVEGDYTNSQLSLVILGLVILGHILVALPLGQTIHQVLSLLVFGGDILLGIFTFGIALWAQNGKVFSFHKFEHDLQPILIGGLLIAIDNIGILAEPSIVWFGQALPLGWIPVELLPVVLALMLFVITGVISALADNALATKVFILLPITIGAGLIEQGTSPEQAALVANAGALGVIVGALTWGWITVQGNLPNFPIKSAFGIDPVYWIKVGLPSYWWTLFVPAVGIVLVVQYVLPGIIGPLNLPTGDAAGGTGH